jgi:hypothetical protein
VAAAPWHAITQQLVLVGVLMPQQAAAAAAAAAAHSAAQATWT